MIDLTNEASSSESSEQKSDESLDGPRFTYAPLLMEFAVQDLKDTIVSDHYNQKEGQVYMLSDPARTTTSFKIGSSKNVSKRMVQHRRQCGLEGWALQIQPPVEIKQCSRLDRLAQAELKNLNCEPRCACRTRHVEYYCGRPKFAWR
ncbi:hypothetical protein BDV12DRAFT_94501 [Aspergillus spectabilis]